MSPRTYALLAVGLALVLTPFWSPALDVTGRDYEYRSARVVADGGGIAVTTDDPIDGIEGVDCLGSVRPAYGCGVVAIRRAGRYA